jgi:hypothetical protein
METNHARLILLETNIASRSMSRTCRGATRLSTLISKVRRSALTAGIRSWTKVERQSVSSLVEKVGRRNLSSVTAVTHKNKIDNLQYNKRNEHPIILLFIYPSLYRTMIIVVYL